MWRTRLGGFNSVTGGAETDRQHLSPAVAMTTLNLIDLTCPVCETEFRSQTVVATNGYGGKRTDFHERAAGMQPLPYFVHLCTHCGYAGVARDFGEGVDPSEGTGMVGARAGVAILAAVGFAQV
jgi:hypothetical protein